MNIQHKNENTFDGTINISSNIKDNKNTIIGKFDLKDIFFIFIAGVIGIIILSLMLAVFSIRNMFLIFIVLAIFEVPIVTLGFFKIYNIPIIDYIKMKSKSDNKSYRQQIRKRKIAKKEKYIFTICLDIVGANAYIVGANADIVGANADIVGSNADIVGSNADIVGSNADIVGSNTDIVGANADIVGANANVVGANADIVGANACGALHRLEQIMNELNDFISYKNIEIKIIFSKVFLTIDIEKLSDVKYDKLFDYLRLNRDIKFISMEDIKIYETYIKSLKFAGKKYGKKQNKEIEGLKAKLNKLHKIDETNARYEYLTNKVLDIKDNELIKVYKFTLYKSPFDLRIFDELKSISSITIHAIKDSDKLLDLSYINTFVDITGTSDEIEAKYIEIKGILNKHHILYKEISEEKVKDSLLFLLENRY